MKKVRVLLIVSILILSGCRGKENISGQPAELQISDSAKQLEAAAGNEFKIILNSNPTTGYHWEVMGELDTNVIEFVSKNYKADGLQTAGSGGKDVWIFKAIAAGETTITLGNDPPDASADAEQTITFTVVVK